MAHKLRTLVTLTKDCSQPSVISATRDLMGSSGLCNCRHADSAYTSVQACNTQACDS